MVHDALTGWDAGIETAIGKYSFGAIGIYGLLECGGDINIAKRVALERQNDGPLRQARR